MYALVRPEVFELMHQDAVVIGVLGICDSCVCCLSPGSELSYVEEAAIGEGLKVDSGVVVWNLLKHCRR